MELKNFYAQDTEGNVQPGASCYLYHVGTETLVEGLVDSNDVPKSNPFFSDVYGLIQFKAPDGLYDFRIAAGSSDNRIRIQFIDALEAMVEINATKDIVIGAVDSAIDASTVATQQSIIATQAAADADSAASTVINRGLIKPIGQVDYNATNNIIKQLADGVEDQDAINLRGMRSFVAGEFVKYDKFTPTDGSMYFRTHLNKLRDTVSIKDFGAIGNGIADDSPSLRLAIANRVNNWAVVRIPAGVYKISSQIEIPARTVFLLDAGAILKHAASDEMLFINGQAGNSNYASGYDGNGDIYIIGRGARIDIDATTGYKGFARFAHGRNIVCQGIEVYGGYRAHNIEINSCNGVLIDQCKFIEHRSPEGETNFEAIQIDHAVSGGLPEFGSYDLTPCRNVKVTNCYFKNVFTPFGSHSNPDLATGLHTNIHFLDNVIEGYRGQAIRLQGMRNSSFQRNDWKGAGSTARGPVIWSCQRFLAHSNVLDMATCTGLVFTIGDSAVDYFSENVDIIGNTIKNAENNPIYFTNCTNGKAVGNIMESCAKPIYLNVAFGIDVIGNEYKSGSPLYLVQIAGTSSGNSLSKNKGTYTTSRYSTDNYLTEIDGETMLAAGTFGASAAITLRGPINNYRALVVGCGSVSGGTFTTQYLRGYTSVGFELGKSYRILTASGVIVATVDTETQITLTSITGAESLRFIYGIERRV